VGQVFQELLARVFLAGVQFKRFRLQFSGRIDRLFQSPLRADEDRFVGGSPGPQSGDPHRFIQFGEINDGRAVVEGD
jgi:hypothetical protein